MGVLEGVDVSEGVNVSVGVLEGVKVSEGVREDVTVLEGVMEDVTVSEEVTVSVGVAVGAGAYSAVGGVKFEVQRAIPLEMRNSSSQPLR